MYDLSIFAVHCRVMGAVRATGACGQRMLFACWMGTCALGNDCRGADACSLRQLLSSCHSGRLMALQTMGR